MVKRKQAEKSVQQLIQDLDLQSTYTRKNAIIRLAEKKAVEAVPHLNALCEAPDATLKACAAWALGEIGDAKSVKTLEKLLKDLDTEVRRSAVRALWTLGDPSCEKALKQALRPVVFHSHLRRTPILSTQQYFQMLSLNNPKDLLQT